MSNHHKKAAKTLVEYYGNRLGKKVGPYRIHRMSLRALCGLARIEAGALEKIDGHMRDEGYFIAPIDTADWSYAQYWVVQRQGRVDQLPLVEYEADGEDEDLEDEVA